MTPAFLSCTSTRQKENRIVYERPTVPDPYEEGGVGLVKYNPDTDEVRMPLWYWKKLVRYIIDAEAALDEIDAQNQ